MKSTRTSIYRSSQALSYSRNLGLGCRKPGSERVLTINHNHHSSLADYRSNLQDANTSSIAKQIRETGQLPSLPTESVVKLPKLKRQRKPRDENIIRGDMQATLEAHYAANVLAHGNIHIRLDDSSYSKSRKLAVTPPAKSHDMEHTQRLLAKYANEDKDLIPQLISLDNSERENLSPATVRKMYARDETRPRELRDKLLQANQGLDALHKLDVKIQREPIRKKSGLVTTSELRDKLLQADQSLDALHRLDSEIRIFHDWIELTQDEIDAASYTWSKFQRKMFKNFPDYKFELHGSRTTGLARPFSDIDIKMTIPELEKEKLARGPSSSRRQIKKKYIQALLRIKRWSEKEIASGLIVNALRSCKIPVLDMQTRTVGRFAIQLSAVVGKPIELNTEYVKYFLKEYPQIKPLFVLIRWWLERSNIGDASTGGVSSYLTFNMILTSITHSKQLFDDGELGKQLIHFLRFWIEADWRNLGFAPDPARTFPKCATNLEEENCLEEIQTKQDRASETLFANKLPYNSTAAEPDLRESQLRTTVPSSNIDNCNNALLSTLTQVDPLNRLAIESEDIVTPATNDQESDVYLEGIKFLAHQANQKCRRPASRLEYFLLQDPADPRNNVGSSLEKLRELCQLMERALGSLEKKMRSWDKRELSSKAHQSEEFLLKDLIYVKRRNDPPNSGVDRILQIFEEKRRKLAWMRPLKVTELESTQTEIDDI